MNRGYIKLWRKTLDTEILKNHKLWAFWSWCLMKASHKRYVQLVGFQEIELFPGQFIFGRSAAAKDLAMSVQNIRTCVQYLSKHENLTIKSTNKFSIITIVNWGIYQQQDEENNQQYNKRLTSKQPASNQQVTTNKNVENGKNEKKPPIPPTGADGDFSAFWDAYPKKKAKQAALKTWTNLSKKKALPDISVILEAIQKQRSTQDWQKDGGQFIPHPATWLNAGRWDDKIECQINDTPACTPKVFSNGEDLYR